MRGATLAKGRINGIRSTIAPASGNNIRSTDSESRKANNIARLPDVLAKEILPNHEVPDHGVNTYLIARRARSKRSELKVIECAGSSFSILAARPKNPDV